MIKLKRLKILKYRNVKPGTELHFDDGVNLILGQNASGKTTLLALISAILRGRFQDIRHEEYSFEADVILDGVTTTLSASQKPPHGRQSESPRLSDVWPQQVSVSSVPDGKPPTIPSGWMELTFDFEAQTTSDLSDTYRFDESLAAFAATVGTALDLAGPSVPPPIRAERKEVAEDEFYFFDSYIPPGIRSRLSTERGADAIFQRPLGSADLELCRDIATALEVSDVTLQPDFQVLRLHGDEHVFKISSFTFRVHSSTHDFIKHDVLSYGQKRLLAFFYYLACNPSIVIADELVNGLHHRWIEGCMKAIGDRQAFLTSQNPLLFDYVEFDSVEQVRSRFITCRIERGDDREYMVWENMSEDDATRFFDAYQAGIEHVGDILITRGMW